MGGRGHTICGLWSLAPSFTFEPKASLSPRPAKSHHDRPSGPETAVRGGNVQGKEAMRANIQEGRGWGWCWGVADG